MPREWFSRIAVIVVFGHAEPARAAGLRAPDINRLEFARDRHRRQHPHPHVERAFKPNKRAEMREAAGEFRAVQEHRKRALQRAAARHDAVDDRAVLAGTWSLLVIAGSLAMVTPLAFKKLSYRAGGRRSIP